MEGVGLNTVRLDEGAVWIRWRPGVWPVRPGSWDTRSRLDHDGREISWYACRRATIMRGVLGVSPLDHARRALVERSRRADAGAGCEEFMEPPEPASGSLWGERPQTGAVCAAAVRHVP